eukprot:3080887-Amphidinium_carterae.1
MRRAPSASPSGGAPQLCICAHVCASLGSVDSGAGVLRMVEVVGKDKLSEVADLFTVMEESGENSVSSLQLAVALVLCNEHASPSFKASSSI